jgi:hypothetical protein
LTEYFRRAKAEPSCGQMAIFDERFRQTVIVEPGDVERGPEAFQSV